MLLLKISNTQNLNLKLNHGLQPGLGYSIKIIKKNFTRVCARKKIHTKKKIMKDNSKHTVILYLHYLGRLKNLITNNTLVTTKKT